MASARCLEGQVIRKWCFHPVVSALRFFGQAKMRVPRDRDADCIAKLTGDADLIEMCRTSPVEPVVLFLSENSD